MKWCRSSRLLQAGESDVARLVEADGSALPACRLYTTHADYLTADINRDWRDALAGLAAGFHAAAAAV